MNVVKKELKPQKCQSKLRSELIRKDATSGIRVPTISMLSFKTNMAGPRFKARRQAFDESSTRSNKSFMGPPVAPSRSLKRKFTQSSSIRPDSVSSGTRNQVLASDSVVGSTHDITTPRKRPATLRYISSSSRAGGHSGTRSARSTSTFVVEPSVILAISEGRGMARGEIGMAAVDLQHPHLVLCQFSDSLLYTHTLTKINYFNPVEIIVPHTFCEGGKGSPLWQLVREQRPHLVVTAVQRRHFNDETARQQIQSLCAPHYRAVYLQVLHKFYALSAAAAVLKYVEYIQRIVFARESLKIEYHCSENTMIIDVGTAMQLELVQPLVPSAGPTCCLLGVLGPTYTVGGIRALRASLLQPSCKRMFIESRLDAVQELIENDTGLMVDLQNVLKKLSEVDKILFLCIETQSGTMNKYGEAEIIQTLLLKTTMELVPNLLEALKEVESAQLRKIKTELEHPNYKEITDRIRNLIQDDAHHERGAVGSLQRCFAVKPNINGLLDVARRMYSELIDDIQKIVESLSETHDLPLRMNQNVMKGFHIVMPVAPKNRRHFNVEDLPPNFIQVVFNGANVTMTTEELVVLDHQAKEALSEIQKITNIVISTLLKELRPFMSSLYKLCEDVAELDILVALAQCSSIGSYIRPEFNNYTEIRNSVHPLLDYNVQVSPVPNDIFATPEHNFTVITGPNMGGKSIYIKQIAILQIMAQLGCFVPATSAVFRLCDRMFSRIGFNDCVELNASTYVIEMKEIQHILQSLTPTSLVIIDELCRGTSIEEGTSVSWAVCEELLDSEAFTFFTTHFMYLTRLQEVYFNVLNRHAVVTEQEIGSTQNKHKKLVYEHKIEPGISKIQYYGLALAAITNLPEETVNLAKELAELMNDHDHTQQISTPLTTDEALLYKLNADIKLESRKYSNADSQIQKIKQQFKGDHPQLIEKLLIEKKYSSKSVDVGRLTEPDKSRLETSNDVDSSITDFIEATLLNTTAQTTPTRSISKLTHNAKENFTPNPGFTSNPNLKDSEASIINSNEKYTAVKSSTELLNTFTSIERLTHEQEKVTVSPINNEEIAILSDHSPNRSITINDENLDVSQTETQYESQMYSEDDSNNSDGEIDSLYGDDDDFLNNKDDIESYKNDEDASSGIALSDIADEITQVIENDNMSMNSQTNAEEMSIDEEFIAETVNEINEELMVASMEHLILTPPCDFQD